MRHAPDAIADAVLDGLMAEGRRQPVVGRGLVRVETTAPVSAFSRTNDCRVSASVDVTTCVRTLLPVRSLAPTTAACELFALVPAHATYAGLVDIGGADASGARRISGWSPDRGCSFIKDTPLRFVVIR